MGRHLENHLPEVHDVLSAHPPLADKLMQQSRGAVQAILSGEDDRLLVIQGPCSFYSVEAGLKHARAMRDLQWDIRDHVLLVERAYIQKPRTRGGWAGIQLQPDPKGSMDANRGVWESRKAMHRTAQIMSIADEILFPENGPYFDDLISYGAIGARNIESMQHRWAASGLDYPVGMKNPRCGNLHSAVDAIVVAQQPNTMVINRGQWQTDGNPFAHLVLRGGRKKPNYNVASVAEASRLLEEADVQNPAIIIDASHDNAVHPRTKMKTPEQQLVVLRQSIRNKIRNPDLFRNVKGFMFESFLLPGNQKVVEGEEIIEGLSITDPCVGLEDSIDALHDIAERVRKSRKVHV